MPSNVIATFAKKSGKSEQEVEKIWNDTKKIVSKEYPELKPDDDSYWAIVNRVTQKRLKITNEDGVAQSDATPSITTTTAEVGAGMGGSYSPKMGKIISRYKKNQDDED